MALANIEELLEKYFEAEATLAEEKELIRYFSSTDVAPHLKQYVGLFTTFSIDKKQQYSRPLLSEKSVFSTRKLKVASFVLVAVLGFFVKKEYDKYILHKQLSQVKEVLFIVSDNINKGRKTIAESFLDKTKSIKKDN